MVNKNQASKTTMINGDKKKGISHISLGKKFLFVFVLGFLAYPIVSWGLGQFGDQMYYAVNKDSFSVCRDIDNQKMIGLSDEEQRQEVHSILALPEWLVPVDIYNEFSSLKVNGSSDSVWGETGIFAVTTSTFQKRFVYKSTKSANELSNYIYSSMKQSVGYSKSSSFGNDDKLSLLPGFENVFSTDTNSKEKLSNCVSSFVARQVNYITTDGKLIPYMVIEIDKDLR